MTTTTYDFLGRVIKVRTADNQESATSFDGNTVTATDQANKKRRSITNAIGQITRVDEPNNLNDLGTISNPTQPTHYSYNASGNLVKVVQGQQNRYFLYDSLGRLIRVRQPEQTTNASLSISDPVTDNSQWSIGSTYDANGNVLTTLDPKGILTTQTYDNLNRVLNRTYSDGTPVVTYQYDNVAVPFSRGQLTKISSSVSTTENTAFDAVGKVISHKQIIDGQTYTTAYEYNLSGTLVEETYPSGRTIKNVLSLDGKLIDVSSKRAGQDSFLSYANNFVYEASGAVSALRLGNGNWENVQFNSRLQIVQIGLGTSQGATNLWKANYDYGEIDENGNLNPQKNNGNIARQTMGFTGSNQSFVQSSKYDSLSRLAEAKEVQGTIQTWKQNFGYDRYGNRLNLNQEIGSELINQTLSVDPTTNRFTTGQGFTYDFNGNLIQNPNGHQFTFNGDNKQVEVKDTAQNVIGLYYYDGNGARVKKISGSETTIFVYNAYGTLVAEYSTQTTTSPTISYLTNDVLGSPRVITDNGGNVISRRDFMPFGEELVAGKANRTENMKYSAGIDNVRKRFTTYEKDSETGLDFAEARMYDNLNGRFTAVDPLLASGQSADPQTFNRYAYVSNNPINSTDSTGLWSDQQWTSTGGGFFTPDLSNLLSFSKTGDYYDRGTGDYIGSDGIKDNKVYAATETHRIVLANGYTTHFFKDAQLLPITHTEFLDRAATTYGESSAFRMPVSVDLANEMMAIAYVNQRNNKAYGANNAQAKAFKNTKLEDRNGKMQLANFAIINSVTGGPDPSNGAIMWDGAEQAYYPASNTNRSDKQKGFELHMNTMGWNISNQDYATWKANVGSGFKAPQIRVSPANYGGYRNKGKTRLHSTAVYGGTIFWRVQ